jgi:HlyD family secretion protein
VQIVVWQSADAVMVPSSALFRQGDDWAVFRVVGDRALLQTVDIGRNNGRDAEVLGGLTAGEVVVLFPSADLADGEMVAQRAVD